MLRLVPPNADAALTSPDRLRRRRSTWQAAWWAVVIGVLLGLNPVAAVLADGPWLARLTVVVALPLAGMALVALLAGVRARIVDLDVDLAIRLRQEDSDRVLDRLRADVPRRPAHLHVECAQDSPDRVARDVALVKAYMSTRPYDLETEVYDTGRSEALLSYRLREAS